MSELDAQRANPRRWLALAVLVLPVLLVSMDFSVLYLAIPAIGADLDPSSTQTLWILDIYGFVLASLLITMGNLGDRYGRRAILLLGAAVFGAASVLSAFSASPEMLILGRALMGLGGATLMPSTLALIRNMFEDSAERAKAVGIWTAAFAAGGALGPVIGGALLNFFGWGVVFLINVPVLAILLVAAPILVPEHRNDTETTRFDLLGAALSVVAILPLVYAVKHAAEVTGWDVRASVALLIGVLGAGLFVQRLRRAEYPLIDTSLFRQRYFVVALAAITLGIMALMGPNMYLAQYLQLVQGHSALTTALWMLPMTFSAMIGAVLAPQLRATLGASTTMAVGFSAAALGLVAIAMASVVDGALIVIAGGFILAGGVTMVMTLGTDVVVGSASTEQSGAASALQETGSELGGAMGVAIIGSLGAAVYRSRLESAGDYPKAAYDSLMAAKDVANGVADPLRSALVAAADDAFTMGLTVAAGIAAVGMAVLAVVISVAIRGVDTALVRQPVLEGDAYPSDDRAGGHQVTELSQRGEV